MSVINTRDRSGVFYESEVSGAIMVVSGNAGNINRDNNMLLYQRSVYIMFQVTALEESVKIILGISFNLLWPF